MKKLIARFSCLTMNNKGQGLVEYALILMLMAMVVFLALAMLGGEVNNTYSKVIISGVTSAGFK
jgi:pilus assembly protein Flp/PilA